MPKFCPECGETIKAGTRFCKQCGHKLSAEGEKMPTMPKTLSVPKKHSGFGIAALVLGIIPMCLIWLSFWSYFYFFVELPMGIIATILGAVGFWGKWKDNYGLAGFVLGILVISIGIVFALLPWAI